MCLGPAPSVVPVAGEARDDIAEQAAFGFQILAAACNPPMEPSELYKQVDLHLTESVSHHKFLFEDVPKLFNLYLKVGSNILCHSSYLVQQTVCCSSPAWLRCPLVLRVALPSRAWAMAIVRISLSLLQ